MLRCLYNELFAFLCVEQLRFQDKEQIRITILMNITTLNK